MKRYWFTAWWWQQRVAKVVCSAIGHRMELRVSFDIEWDVCNRCHLYMTPFRTHPGWASAMTDPAFVAALDEGLADYKAGRVKPWKPA